MSDTKASVLRLHLSTEHQRLLESIYTRFMEGERGPVDQTTWIRNIIDFSIRLCHPQEYFTVTNPHAKACAQKDILTEAGRVKARESNPPWEGPLIEPDKVASLVAPVSAPQGSPQIGVSEDPIEDTGLEEKPASGAPDASEGTSREEPLYETTTPDNRWDVC